MLRRFLALPIALGLAVGIPYFAMNPDLRARAGRIWNSMSENQSSESIGLEILHPGHSNDVETDSIRNHTHARDTALLYTPRVDDFRDVFRMDVTPNWVKSRWPRVSICSGENEMEGFRVPLVTGTKLDDLHGSLTYYFDERHRVQRIGFYGYTGDASRLVRLVSEHFGFLPRKTHHAGLYVSMYMGQPSGALRITNASVVRSDTPNEHLQVMLEINSADGKFRLSESFARQLAQDAAAGRWE